MGDWRLQQSAASRHERVNTESEHEQRDRSEPRERDAKGTKEAARKWRTNNCAHHTRTHLSDTRQTQKGRHRRRLTRARKRGSEKKASVQTKRPARKVLNSVSQGEEERREKGRRGRPGARQW
eukprot:3940458-Rhodomonas_salina.2